MVSRWYLNGGNLEIGSTDGEFLVSVVYFIYANPAPRLDCRSKQKYKCCSEQHAKILCAKRKAN